MISLGSSSSSSSSISSSGSSSGDIAGVDGTVQRIARTYEVRGVLQNVTSYSSPIPGQGTVVNDVQRVYNSFEQLVTEYQEHSGAVNTSTSVNVQYEYADGSSNTIRPTALVYPNDRVLTYSYGASGGIDDALSRIAGLIDNDGSNHLVDYTRIGHDTFVEQSSPEPQIAWSLINGSGSDPYSGLDQFNRVVDNRWYSTATSADLDRIQHGYDRASNRLWRKNTVAEAAGVYLDEIYAYDGLYRLSQMQRGLLNISNAAIASSTLNFSQAWGLDATGNWQQFWEDDSGSSWTLQQSRTANTVNEIMDITGGGWAQPAYDAGGNVVQMPQPSNPTTGDVATFDAWNNMTTVWSGGSCTQQNGYDGLKRRATSLVPGALRHYYYSTKWEALEERLGSAFSADRQFVGGPRYVDDLILRDRGTERLYAVQDPNWNVTAIATASGSILERYTYSSYGEAAFKNADFGARLSSGYDWESLFSAYRWDADVQLYYVRHRWLNTVVGWLARQLIGIVSHALICKYCVVAPVNSPDPSGLDDPQPAIEPDDGNGATIRVCATDITPPSRPVGHLYLVVNTTHGEWGYRAGPQQEPKFCAGDNANKLWPNFGPYNNRDNFVDYLPPDEEDCVSIATKLQADAIEDCLLKASFKLRDCCIAYDPAGNNSNSYVWWMLNMCVPDGRLKINKKLKQIKPLIGFNNLWLTPGYGTGDTPDCLK